MVSMMFEKNQKSEQEKFYYDIITGSMYSVNFLRNISEGIFHPEHNTLTIGEFYDQWIRKNDLPHDSIIPYNFGVIFGYLYCGLVLPKTKFDFLIPEDSILEVGSDWYLSSPKFNYPLNPNPTVVDVIRRIRNSLSHGSFTIKIDHNSNSDFENQMIILFHDEKRDKKKKLMDTFDIELSLFQLSKLITKIQGIIRHHVLDE